jgi:hypothetical protein
MKSAKMDEFKTACGFDPVDSIGSIAMGVKTSSDDPDGVLVVHGFDKAKINGCFDKVKEEMAKEGTTLTRDGEIITSTNKNGGPTVMTFVNSNTLVVQMGKGANKDTLAAVTSGSKGVKSSQAFSDMYGKTKPSTLRFFVNGSMKQLESVSGTMGVGKFTAAFGSLNVTDGLSLDAFLRMDNAENATKTAATMQSQVGMIKSMVTKAEVTSSDKDVRFDVGVSAQQLQSLMSMSGMMGR